MTDTIRTYDCPAPDCGFSAGGAAELAEHVNATHPGEFRREDWPDTEAGRRSREPGDEDDENE